MDGRQELKLSQYGSGEASHWFCSYCGIRTFGRPRMDPRRYTVNVRCLDDYAAIVASVPRRHFDGVHHPKDA